MAVDIELEHYAGVIAGPAGLEWLDAYKTQLVQIETVDEHVDHAHRVVLAHIIVERCREKCALPPTNSFNKALHSDAASTEVGQVRHQCQRRTGHTRPRDPTVKPCYSPQAR